MCCSKKYRLLRSSIRWSLVLIVLTVIAFSIFNPADYGNKKVDEAFITIALAAIAAAASIYAGIKANSDKKKLAEQMERAKLNRPEGLTNAENTLTALASQGLPGKDLMEDALKEPLAQSLTNIRELGASPVTIAGMASTGMSSVTDNIRKLLVEDANAKMGNMIALANFQAGPAAQFDLQQQEFNINKELGASYARMEGTNELFQGIANGMGTMAGAIGNQEYLNYLKSMNQPFPITNPTPSKAGGPDSTLISPAKNGSSITDPMSVNLPEGFVPGTYGQKVVMDPKSFGYADKQLYNPSVNPGFQLSDPSMAPGFASHPYFYGRTAMTNPSMNGATPFSYAFNNGVNGGWGSPIGYKSNSSMNVLSFNPQEAFGYIKNGI